jgi:hypothetical protein
MSDPLDMSLCSLHTRSRLYFRSPPPQLPGWPSTVSSEDSSTGRWSHSNRLPHKKRPSCTTHTLKGWRRSQGMWLWKRRS